MKQLSSYLQSISHQLPNYTCDEQLFQHNSGSGLSESPQRASSQRHPFQLVVIVAFYSTSLHALILSEVFFWPMSITVMACGIMQQVLVLNDYTHGLGAGVYNILVVHCTDL